MTGRELSVRYAVLDQLRSFEFRLALVHDHLRADKATVVKMWPSNPFVQRFVSPLYLRFTPDGREFLGMTGRLLPVAVNHGKPRPLDRGPRAGRE